MSSSAVLTETIETIEWTPAGVVMIDQTKLPRETTFVTCRTYIEVADAIRSMIIRGAPAIGVAAAMGVAIGALHSDNLETDMPVICETLAKTRPTAVNLFWAIDRMKKLFGQLAAQDASLDEVKASILAEADAMYEEDIAACKAMGALGGALLPDRKVGHIFVRGPSVMQGYDGLAGETAARWA